jgi:thioredoxin reductase
MDRAEGCSIPPGRGVKCLDMVTRDVIIVGAGPSGLAAAIACERRGLDYEVIERGVLVNGVVWVETDGQRQELPADAVLLLTGYHTDREFLKRCGVQVDSVTCVPYHDADTFETNVPNVFLAGGVIVGADTAPVFIENGRLHGEKVVGLIASRLGR